MEVRRGALTFSLVTQGIDQTCLFSVTLGPEVPCGAVYTLLVGQLSWRKWGVV